jgi:hypothetical protein
MNHGVTSSGAGQLLRHDEFVARCAQCRDDPVQCIDGSAGGRKPPARSTCHPWPFRHAGWTNRRGLPLPKIPATRIVSSGIGSEHWPNPPVGGRQIPPIDAVAMHVGRRGFGYDYETRRDRGRRPTQVLRPAPLTRHEEDTMHPDIAYRLADQRHAELMAAVAHQRLVDGAKPSRERLAGRRLVARHWSWVLGPDRAMS